MKYFLLNNFHTMISLSCNTKILCSIILVNVFTLNIISLFYFLCIDLNIINHILEGKSCKRRLTFLSPDKEEKVVPIASKRKRKLISHVWIYIDMLCVTVFNFISSLQDMHVSNATCDAKVRTQLIYLLNAT